jgi:hypothetical protein
LAEPETTRTDGTTILWGDPAPDWTYSHPGVVENEYGAGRCTYLPFPIRSDGVPNLWIKRLVGCLVADAVETPVLSTDAGPGIEITVNRQRNRLVVHLCNHYAGDPARLSIGDNLMTVSGVQIDIDMEQAGLRSVARVYEAPGTPVDHEVRDRLLCIAVPDFTVHSVIVIE